MGMRWGIDADRLVWFPTTCSADFMTAALVIPWRDDRNASTHASVVGRRRLHGKLHRGLFTSSGCGRVGTRRADASNYALSVFGEKPSASHGILRDLAATSDANSAIRFPRTFDLGWVLSLVPETGDASKGVPMRE